MSVAGPSRSTTSRSPVSSMGRGRLVCGASKAVAFCGFGGRRECSARHATGGTDAPGKCTAALHPHFTIAHQKPIDYAVADILLTRGEGKVNDRRFARAVRLGAPSPEDYLIEKFRHLAVTEGLTIKTAACIQLGICAQDRGASQSLRNIAREAMRQADCGCITKPDGMPDCGAKCRHKQRSAPVSGLSETWRFRPRAWSSDAQQTSIKHAFVVQRPLRRTRESFVPRRQWGKLET